MYGTVAWPTHPKLQKLFKPPLFLFLIIKLQHLFTILCKFCFEFSYQTVDKDSFAATHIRLMVFVQICKFGVLL